MFYTSIEHYKGKMLCRVVDNLGNRIQTKDAYFEPSLYVPTDKESEFTDIYGNNLNKIQFKSPFEMYSWYRSRKDLTDIYGTKNMVQQYMAKKFNAAEQFDVWDMNKLRICYIDIETTVTAKFAEPDQALNPIYAITYYDSLDDTFYTHVWEGCGNGKSDKSGSFDPKKSQFRGKLKCYKYNTERELLAGFVSHYSKKKYDIITGFKNASFDEPYIVNRIEKILGEGRSNKLSPWGIVEEKTVKFKVGGMFKESQGYKIFGTSSIDYRDIYMKFELSPRPAYNLDTIAEIELNENKLQHESGVPGHLLYREHFHDGIEYNIQDVALLPKLEEKKGFIELLLTFAYYSGSNYEDILSPIRTWHNIMYSYLYNQNQFIKLRKEIPEKTEKFSGGFVKEPVPGIYSWFATFDVTSLYPTIIRMLNISPETLTEKTSDMSTVDRILNELPIKIKNTNCAMAANGVEYRRDSQGFLAYLIEDMFFKRIEYKNKLKIYANLSKLPQDELRDLVNKELESRQNK